MDLKRSTQVSLKEETISSLSEKSNSKGLSPYSLPNVRRFIAFRLFFNARFYYPVFTILFLDFGLSLDQFALLNSIWAATIVIMEVPSGALADIVGRKRLLVFSAFLMILEMGLICLLPIGKSPWLFPVFALNRVLSGIAQASASGADEALAFDSLVSADLKDQWGRVLEMLMRVQAIGLIVAMSIGAAMYDPNLMQQLANLIHLNIHLTQSISLRFPLYLTLGMAVLTFWVTMGMHETDHLNHDNRQATSIKTAFKLSFSAGGWILRTPFALTIILAGLIFDSIARMVITLSSQYYRLIDLPEATFGLVGSLVAALGLFVPRLARGLSQRRSPFVNFGITGAVTFSGLFGMTFFLPIIGLIPALVLFGGMQLTSFFVSHYLNQITDSSQRATVLSIKGLLYNLAYGLIGIFYSLLVSNLKSDIAANLTSISEAQLQQEVFMAAMQWFPWTFMATLLVFVLYGRWLFIRKVFDLSD